MSTKTIKDIKLPKIGRVGLFRESAGEGSGMIAQSGYETNLSAQVIRNGRPLAASEVMGRWSRFWGNINGADTQIDLGSGLVTNVGVMAATYDWSYGNPSGATNTTLALANNHFTGTGATAAAATDIKIQTISTQGGQTPVAGAQSSVTAANSQGYKTVATINYTGTEAVTEWGLITASTVSSTTGTPLTAVSATSATATATPFTASSSTVAGQQLHIINTGTTASWGLIISNTTSVLSLANNGTTGWWKVADGTAGTTPGSTEAYTLYPILWDHKVFSAINVINGDSIQFTYTVTINSGG